LHRHLRSALAACKLPSLTRYQATRHTFASQWVLGGGSIEKLAAVMGHSSLVVTERYAHLRPDLFRDSDYGLLDVDLASGGQVVLLAELKAESGAVGYAAVAQAEQSAEGGRETTEKTEPCGRSSVVEHRLPNSSQRAVSVR